MRMRKWSVWLGTVVLAAAVAWTLNGPAPTTQGPVTFERLLKAADEPGNWLMYSHSYNSWRYSSLNQINPQTVKNLHVKWRSLRPRRYGPTGSCISRVPRTPSTRWTRPPAVSSGATNTAIRREPIT